MNFQYLQLLYVLQNSETYINYLLIICGAIISVNIIYNQC